MLKSMRSPVGSDDDPTQWGHTKTSRSRLLRSNQVEATTNTTNHHRRNSTPMATRCQEQHPSPDLVDYEKHAKDLRWSPKYV